MPDLTFFAEVKPYSPFPVPHGTTSPHSWDELFAVAAHYGDILSIHTDPRWGGSFDLIRKARELSEKPILAKGIHASDDDIEEALEAGADMVLVVGRLPNIHLEKCLIEPTTLDELQKFSVEIAEKGIVPRMVWNSRDLATGELKKETWADARRLYKGWLCQASNIATIDDIAEGADAILVGTHLLEFVQSLGLKDEVKENTTTGV